jgi:hypothetical protein
LDAGILLFPGNQEKDGCDIDGARPDMYHKDKKTIRSLDDKSFQTVHDTLNKKVSIFYEARAHTIADLSPNLNRK